MNEELKISTALKKYSLENEIKYRDALCRFFEEEFIYRLHCSRYSSSLCLRGGFLVDRLAEVERGACNLDFLYIDDGLTVDTLGELIEQILNSGSRYSAVGLKVLKIEQLSADRQYDGLRLCFAATWANKN